MRRIRTLLAITVVASACGGSPVDAGAVGSLPETSPQHLGELLATSERPVLLNVWASWCIPCRSEAPLLAAAHAEFGGDIRFVGLNVRDGQTNAREFLAEFDLAGFEHYFDPSGAAQGSLGAGGVPLTFFYDPGAELVELHFGVIDERTLALNIDELIRRSG